MCGSHVGGRSLAYKILRASFYWPTLLLDRVGYSHAWAMGQFKFLIIGFLLLHKLDWGRASGYHHGRATTHGLLKEDNMYVLPIEKYYLQTQDSIHHLLGDRILRRYGYSK
jgi:hypothetical protein